MTVWRLDTGAVEAIRKDASQDGGSNGTTWGDITKESEEMQIEALKEAYEELKEMYGEENGTAFQSDPHVDDNAPSAQILCR